MGIPSIITDRVARLAEHPVLEEVGIASVKSSRDIRRAATEITITCAKGDVVLTLSDLGPREDTIAAVVLGIPQTAPNPARKNQTPFIKWLARHPQLVDAPLDSTALARDAWITRHGAVPQCYLCGHPMRWIIPRSGGAGFWGCTQFSETKCKGSLNVDQDDMVQPRCPDCGKPMRARDGSKGRFWGCTGYRDGCRRTMDGPVGDGLRTEVEDWLPARGKGGLPATATRVKTARAAAKARSDKPAPVPEPSPGQPPSDAQGRGTSLAALRRRFTGDG